MTGVAPENAAELVRAREAYARRAWDDAFMAARVGFWLGYRLNAFGELGQANGWFARVERLIEREGKPCAISGYLRIPQTLRHLAQNECDAAFASAEEA